MKTIFIEKIDQSFMSIGKIKIEQDNLKIGLNLKKEKNIKRIINRLTKCEINNVVLSKELYNEKNLINALNANNINILNGRWLEKYLAIQILDYIVIEKNIEKMETEIAITLNQITNLGIELIKILAREYKKVIVVTNHLEKLRRIEKNIYDDYGVLIVVTNNKKKSLSNAHIVLNFDFNKEILNKYKINENAIIINMEGDMEIYRKRFNGINVNDYEIEVEKDSVVWRNNMQNFKTKDLLEASLYAKDTFENICNRIKKSNVKIKSLYGINGKIESF